MFQGDQKKASTIVNLQASTTIHRVLSCLGPRSRSIPHLLTEVHTYVATLGINLVRHFLNS